MKNFSLPEGVSQKQFDRRRQARAVLESRFQKLSVDETQLGTMDEFYQRAYTLLNSPAARSAFSLDDEPAKVRDLYGRGYILNYRRQPAAIGARSCASRRVGRRWTWSWDWSPAPTTT